jgi:hypothetical protein
LGVVFVITDPEMAVRAAEHVLFLGDRPLDVSTARHVCVGHVEYSETHPVGGRQRTGNLTPIARNHFDSELRHRNLALGPPAIEVLLGEAVIPIWRIGLLERS